MEDKAKTGIYIKSIIPGSAVAQVSLIFFSEMYKCPLNFCFFSNCLY